jgi:hypothetical protein
VGSESVRRFPDRPRKARRSFEDSLIIININNPESLNKTCIFYIIRDVRPSKLGYTCISCHIKCNGGELHMCRKCHIPCCYSLYPTSCCCSRCSCSTVTMCCPTKCKCKKKKHKCKCKKKKKHSCRRLRTGHSS